MPLDIHEATERVRTLAAEGDHEGVAVLVEAAEALPARTTDEMRLLVAFLFEAGRRGAIEAVVNRFSKRAVADVDAQLFSAETFVKLGRPTLAIHLINTLCPMTRDECMRTGDVWTRLGHNMQAAAIYEKVIAMAPDDLTCRRALVEAWTRARQPENARRALHELVGRLPDKAHWWAFVADQASLLSDTKLFRRAAGRAESILGTDVYARLLLARACGRSRRAADMKRLLAGVSVDKLPGDGLLEILLDTAEEFRLSDVQLAAAAAIVNRATATPELLSKCRRIVASHDFLGELRANQAAIVRKPFF